MGDALLQSVTLIETFAKSIGIDFHTDWRPDPEFWDLLTGDELDALAAQWKISATGKRTHKIDALRVYAESVAAFPFPKLLKVKPVEIRH